MKYLTYLCIYNKSTAIQCLKPFNHTEYSVIESSLKDKIGSKITQLLMKFNRGDNNENKVIPENLVVVLTTLSLLYLLLLYIVIVVHCYW